MIPLDYLSVARFNGPDAGVFLHAQLSADIAVLESGQATFACYCNPRGQVIGLLLVCRQDQGYLVAAAADLLAGILTRLQMFVLRSRVGFSADPKLRVCGAGQQQDDFAPRTFQPAGMGLSYIFTENGIEDNDGGEVFKAREIRNRLTWLGSETTAKFIPQMLGFDRIGAVSFNKGCYPGQEIVARTRYLGKVKRLPAVVQMEEQVPLKPSDRVELHRQGAWSNAIVIDSVPADGAGTLCFTVAAAEPGDGPDQLRYRDRSYRCATI